MIYAENKETTKIEIRWVVAADVNGLGYQEFFDTKPTTSQINEAVQSFERNYDQLTVSCGGLK